MSLKEHDEAHAMATEQVIDYLKQNPDFFVGRDALLSEMHIPHKSGSATSLVERQVAVLRERNMDMRQRLHKFVDVARDNDKLFEKTRRLTLRLLSCHKFDSVFEAVEDSLRNDFGVEYFTLTLFTTPTLYSNSTVRITEQQEAEQQIAHLLKSEQAVSGVLRPKELLFLFPNQASIKSAACVAIGDKNNLLGFLALGSDSDDYYRINMDTLFLTYIGEILSRLIPQYLPIKSNE